VKKVLIFIILVSIIALSALLLINKRGINHDQANQEITREGFDSYCEKCREENPVCFSCCDVTSPSGEILICQ
jgi:hypothetical protein